MIVFADISSQQLLFFKHNLLCKSLSVLSHTHIYMYIHVLHAYTHIHMHITHTQLEKNATCPTCSSVPYTAPSDMTLAQLCQTLGFDGWDQDHVVGLNATLAFLKKEYVTTNCFCFVWLKVDLFRLLFFVLSLLPFRSNVIMSVFFTFDLSIASPCRM